jgi:hypothetical protein
MLMALEFSPLWGKKPGCPPVELLILCAIDMFRMFFVHASSVACRFLRPLRNKTAGYSPVFHG